MIEFNYESCPFILLLIPSFKYLELKFTSNPSLFFEKEDFPISENVSGVELVLLHDWSISRIGVKEIDSIKNQLTATDSIGTYLYSNLFYCPCFLFAL